MWTWTQLTQWTSFPNSEEIVLRDLTSTGQSYYTPREQGLNFLAIGTHLGSQSDYSLLPRHTDEVWLGFLCKCALQTILLDAVTDLHLFGTHKRDASIQWPLDHINLTRVR